MAPSLLTYTRDVMTCAPKMINHLYPHVKISTRVRGSVAAGVVYQAGRAFPDSCYVS